MKDIELDIIKKKFLPFFKNKKILITGGTGLIGSHKINANYVNFVKNSKKFNESESNANQFLLNRMEVTCKANSIIVALTSGFHGRKPFLKEIDRKLIFLQYHKSFNKNSLLFG